jgi:RsiW-degrading membrane proteinase PrsW (M82 family)
MGTLAANLIGAFIIGMGLAWFNRMTHIDPMWKVLITTGFCGGLTTFSTFSAEVVFLFRKADSAGADEHGDQHAGFVCDDGDRILVIFLRQPAITSER